MQLTKRFGAIDRAVKIVLVKRRTARDLTEHYQHLNNEMDQQTEVYLVIMTQRRRNLSDNAAIGCFQFRWSYRCNTWCLVAKIDCL